MTITAGPGGPFDFGRVVGRTFGAVGHNAISFTVLAAVLAGGPAILSTLGLIGLAGRALGAAGPGAQAGAFLQAGQDMILTLGGGLIGLIANAVLQGAIIYGTAAYLNGRPAGVGDCLAAGLRRCLPLIVLMALSMIAEGFGFVLFFVPGVMMAIAWIAAVPALVVERTGVFEAFGRSADLTRGRRWPIFGLVIVYFVVVGVAQQVAANLVGAVFATGATPLAMLTARLPVSAVVGVFVSVLASAGTASLYYELRTTREGIGPEALAAVFD
jgi:hypothetical protein